MPLKEQILQDMKDSMKQGEKEKKSALRMLLSEIQYAQTASDRSNQLDDRALIDVIGRYKKKLEKSLTNYPEGEQKEAIQREILIVAHYLPKEASQQEIEKVVDEVLKNSEDKNFGRIMKATLAQLGPAGNAKVISEIIKKKLA